MMLHQKVISWIPGYSPASLNCQESIQSRGFTSNRTRLLLSALSFSVVLCACSPSEETNTTGQSNYASRAISYIEAGQYRAAHIELRNADNDDNLTVAERNKLTYAKARWFEALDQHKGTTRAITEIPLENRTVEMQITLLNAFLDSGKLLSAEGVLQQEKGPELPAPVKDLAQAKINLGRGETKQALKQFQQLTETLKPTLKDQNSAPNTEPESNTPTTAPEPTTAQNDTAPTRPAQPQSQEALLYAQAQLGIAQCNLALRNSVQAQTVTQNLLERYPNFVPALLMKARLASMRQDFETAEDALSSALITLPDTDIMQPEKIKVLSAFVALLTRQGRTAEALTYSKILAEQNPEATELQGQLDDALALWREGKLAEAQKSLMELYKQAPTDRIGSLVGLLSFLNGDQETANTYFERHLDPETADANMLLAMTRAFVQEGRMTETIALIEQAHRNNPKDGRITALLGALRLANGNVAGFSIMEDGLKQEPKQKQMWLALAQGRQNIQDDHQKAAQTLEAALIHFPTDARLRRGLIQVLVTSNQTQRAKQLIAGWLKAEGDTIDNLLLAGNFALVQKQTSLASQYFKKAQSIAPDNSSTVTGLALTALAADEFEQAKLFALKLIDLKPTNPMPYLLLGQAQARLTPSRASVSSTLQEAAQAHEQAGGYIALFDYHFSGKELTQAQAALEKARSLDPGYDGLNEREARLSYQLGRNAISEREFAQAREHLIRALQYKPNQQSLNTLLIRLELELGNIREAEKLILQLPEDSVSEDTKAQLNGELALKQGDFATAESILLAAWEEEPSDKVGQVLYKTYLSQSKPVLPFLKEWQSKTKSNMATLYRANELVTAGDYEQAVSEYEKIAPIIERNAVALNNLAWSYQQIGDDRALETAKVALDLAPNDPAVLDTYGFILLKAGKKEQAQAVLKRAHELAPADPQIKANWEAANQ